jgi:hypothetical protein
MPDPIDSFLGLSATAWTALSSIGTFAAVGVALFLPIGQAAARRRNLESAIIRELAIARKALLDIDAPNAFAVTQLNNEQLAMARCKALEIGAWERHRESMAELSFDRFRFYDGAFERVGFVRSRGYDYFENGSIESSVPFTLGLVKQCLQFLDTAPKGVNLKLAKWLD